MVGLKNAGVLEYKETNAVQEFDTSLQTAAFTPRHLATPQQPDRIKVV